MKNENILDESFNESPSINKWKLALIPIVILTIGFALTFFLEDYIPIVFGSYISMILALYFFIKKINYEEINIGELFLWGTFIIFIGNLIINMFYLLFRSDIIIDSFSIFFYFNLGAVFRSVIYGSTLSFGVFHLIKNKSWSMFFLMIFAALMFQTLLIFDPALFGF